MLAAVDRGEPGERRWYVRLTGEDKDFTGEAWAGENITVTGLDWARVRPGVVVDVGTVRCDVTAFAIPCAQNARWFLGGDFNLMHHRNGPVSRVYALVTRPGTIATGDEMVVMPS